MWHDLQLRTTTVPLYVFAGKPFIRAVFAGRERLCLVDTGALTVLWPDDYAFPGRETGFHYASTFIDGYSLRLRESVLPSLSIGNLTLYDAPSYFFRPQKRHGTAPHDATELFYDPADFAGSYPTLGHGVFPNMALEFDYQSKRLAIRDSSLPPSTKSSTPPLALLPRAKQQAMKAQSGAVASGLDPFYILAEGSVNGQKTYFWVDTGTGHDGIQLMPWFVRSLETVEGRQPHINIGRNGQSVSPVTWRLGVAGGRCTAIAGPVDLSGFRELGVGAVIGYHLFARNRVEIDLRREALIVEPQLPTQGSHHLTGALVASLPSGSTVRFPDGTRFVISTARESK